MKKPISYNYCFNDEKKQLVWIGKTLRHVYFLASNSLKHNYLSKSAIHEVTIYNISFWITNDYRLVTNIRIYTYYYM